MNKIFSILKIRENQYFILLLALLVFLSKGYHFSSNAIAVISLFYLIDKNLSNKIKQIDFKFYLPFLLYFAIYIIGILYSHNQRKAWNELNAKLSFLLLPAIILSEKISREKMFKILLFLKYWLFFFALFLLFKQVVLDQRSLWTLAYFSLKDVTNIHQWYFSQFYFLALLLVLYQIHEKSINNKVALLEIIFILFFIVLLSAGPTILMSFAIVFFSIFFLVKNWYIKFVILLALFLGFYLVKDTYFLKKKIHRITHIEWNLEKNIQKHALVFSSEFTDYNTLELRLIKWHLASNIIKNNFFTGVGSGDSQDLLNKSYKEIQFQNGIKFHYNAHNQYLEEGMRFGLIGILLFLYFLGNSLVLAYKQGNLFLVALILFIALSALIESVLARFHGVVFYSVIVPFLYKFYQLKNAEK